jgi:hypothetical protein
MLFMRARIAETPRFSPLEGFIERGKGDKGCRCHNLPLSVVLGM